MHSAGKGLTIKEVVAKDPGYFQRLMSWKNNILDSRHDLKAALEKEGMLEGLLQQRPGLQRARALRAVEKAEEEKSLVLHPEIKKVAS